MNPERLGAIEEYNIVVKKARDLVRIALLYPSTYEVSLSSLAYQMMYYALNSYDDVAAERIVTGEGVRSIETGLSLRSFTMVLVFLHYEVSVAEVVKALWAAGVNPLRSKRRGEPVIIAGGPPVTANPLPYSGIFDAMVVGEAEPLLRRMIDSWNECGDKECFLSGLAGIRGIYVPGRTEAVSKAYARILDEAFHPLREIQPVGREPVWGRGYMLETGRGCARGCRFCMEGHIFLPRRERSLKTVRRLAEEGARLNKVDRIVFYDLAFLDHSDSTGILEEVVEGMGLRVSVPSLRIDALTPRHAELVAKGGQRLLTVAPETPVGCIGRAINKPVGRDMVLEHMREAAEAGIRMFKLYYMVGLPGEPGNIAELIAREVKWFKEMLGGKTMLKLSVNPFIPKPHTPLQWASMASLAELRAKLRKLGRLLPSSVEYSSYDPRWARIQAAIARGDERLTPILVEWGMLGGGLGAWRKALRDNGVGEEELLRPPSLDEPPPWSIIDLLIPQEALKRGYEAYLDAASLCGWKESGHASMSEPSGMH